MRIVLAVLTVVAFAGPAYAIDFEAEVRALVSVPNQGCPDPDTFCAMFYDAYGFDGSGFYTMSWIGGQSWGGQDFTCSETAYNGTVNFDQYYFCHGARQITNEQLSCGTPKWRVTSKPVDGTLSVGGPCDTSYPKERLQPGSYYMPWAQCPCDISRSDQTYSYSGQTCWKEVATVQYPNITNCSVLCSAYERTYCDGIDMHYVNSTACNGWISCRSPFMYAWCQDPLC